MAKFPSPGRGAWRLTGGLLPVKPGSKSKAGYYRLNGTGEVPVGSAFVTKADPTHDEFVVHRGVVAIQSLIGADDDGILGPKTDKKIREAQRSAKVVDDGIVGPATMKALLRPLIEEFAIHNGVPVAVLGGLLVNESGLDPAAVGTNGQDHGLAQINLAAHPKVPVEDALDPDKAIYWTVESLLDSYNSWNGLAKVNAWTIAIAAHNSPALARRWALDGKAPYVEGRIFQIEEYVDRVRVSW